MQCRNDKLVTFVLAAAKAANKAKHQRNVVAMRTWSSTEIDRESLRGSCMGHRRKNLPATADYDIVVAPYIYTSSP